jgi:hypothetical protein
MFTFMNISMTMSPWMFVTMKMLGWFLVAVCFTWHEAPPGAKKVME